MTVLLALLLVAAFVFTAGTIRAVSRSRREAARSRSKAQLRRAVHDARTALDHAQTTHRND